MHSRATQPRGIRANLGRYVFGLGSLATGAVALIWHDAHHQPYAVYAASVALIAGGAAITVRASEKAGAAVLCLGYLVFVALTLPGIVAAPLVYNSWGNFFEQFSLLTGAAIAYARLHRIGGVLLGICALSFAIEQAIYLAPTAALVPQWLPPGRNFWAIATTGAFVLAAIALIANRAAPLASRLLTAMLVSFGIIVWVPLLFADPHSQGNWSEAAETFAIAGAVWMLLSP